MDDLNEQRAFNAELVKKNQLLEARIKEKGMTLVEAYRTGKPIKRKGWRDWYTLRDDRNLTGLRWYNELEGMVYDYITKLDLLSTDWMVLQDAKDIGREPE